MIDSKLLYTVIGGLVTLIIGLVIYIWNERRKEVNTKEEGIQQSINNLELSFRTAIAELNSTIMSLRTIIFEEIESVKRDHGLTKITVAEIKALCKERSKHCPIYRVLEKKEKGEEKNGRSD